jgi:uncharacterized protein (TIRG00374 family)
MKKNINIIAGLVFGAGFLVLAFYNVKLEDVLSGFKKFNPVYIIPITALTVIYFLIRAYRWGLIFKPHPVPSFKSLFSGIMIGVMVNNLIPAKIGEVSRAFILGKKEKTSISLTFGTIIVERIFDFLALFFCFFSVFVFSPAERDFLNNTSAAGKTAFFTTLGGFLALIVLIVVFKYQMRLFVKVVEGVLGVFSKNFASKIDPWFNSFADGLKCLDSFGNSLKIFTVSVFQWALMGFVTWIALISFNIHISLFSASFVMIIVTLGCVLPPSPGGIGTQQLISVLVLKFYNINGGEAMSFSIVQNFLSFAVGTILGIFFLFKESMNFAELIKFSEEKR